MADEEEVVEQENEETEPTVGGDNNPSSTNSSSDEPTPKSTSTITSHRLPMADTSAGYVEVAPHIMTDSSNIQHFKYIEKPGARQLRVNSKGVTGSWTALKFPYKWVEEGIPSGTYPNQNEVKPVIGYLLPTQGNYWSDTFFYCKVQDIEFKELENGLCEATVNYTSEGFTSDMMITTSTELEPYKAPYYCKWDVDTTSDNNPYVEDITYYNKLLNYQITYKMDYTSESTPATRLTYINYMKIAAECVNKVNSDTWHTFPAETVLLEHIDFEPDFAISKQLLSITVKCDFKVRLDSSWTWQYRWKDPTPEKTSKGADLHWHQLPNQPFPEGAFYTTDPNKKGKTIFTGDVIITDNQDGSITVNEVTPEPVHGGKYKPYVYINSTKVNYYASCNFTNLIGIPDITAPAQNNNSNS